MTDDQVRAEWRRLCRMFDRGKSLGKRLALLGCDHLEAAGVTEVEIDRLFPSPRPTTESPDHAE